MTSGGRSSTGMSSTGMGDFNHQNAGRLEDGIQIVREHVAILIAVPFFLATQIRSQLSK